MQLGESARRAAGRSRYRPMSDINVTPLVDVMLVLLIVFMVTAPLLAVGIKVDLPQSQARPLAEDQEPLSITLTASGKIFLQKTEIGLDELVERLRAIAENRTDRQIYVRGDASLAYGKVIAVMGRLNAAGFSKLALVSAPPKRKGR